MIRVACDICRACSRVFLKIGKKLVDVSQVIAPSIGCLLDFFYVYESNGLVEFRQIFKV